MKFVTLLAFAAIVVGAFLTWSDNPPFSETGLERTSGLFALVVAGSAGAITLTDRRPRGAIIAISAATLILIAAAVDFLDISGGSASVGAGLYLTLTGAIVATAAAGLRAFSLFKKPEPAPGPPA